MDGDTEFQAATLVNDEPVYDRITQTFVDHGICPSTSRLLTLSLFTGATDSPLNIGILVDTPIDKSSLAKTLTDTTPNGQYCSGVGMSRAGLIGGSATNEAGVCWGALLSNSPGRLTINSFTEIKSNARKAAYEALTVDEFTLHFNNKQATAKLTRPVTALHNAQTIIDKDNCVSSESGAAPVEFFHGFDIVLPITAPPHPDFEQLATPLTPSTIADYHSYAHLQTQSVSFTPEAQTQFDDRLSDLNVSGWAVNRDVLASLLVSWATIQLSSKIPAVAVEHLFDLIENDQNETFDLCPENIDIASSQRNRDKTPKSVVRELQPDDSSKGAPLDNVREQLKMAGMDDEKIDNELEKAIRGGLAYKPSHNTIRYM